MEQFNHPQSDESRWLTITYLADQKYKALHLVARSRNDLQSLYDTLRRLRALRLAMLSLPADPHLPYFQNGTTVSLPYYSHGSYSQSGTTSSASLETMTTQDTYAAKLNPSRARLVYKNLTHKQHQDLWERQYWKSINPSADGRVDFQGIKQMAHRLSVGINSQELEQIFFDAHHSGGVGMNLEEFGGFWRRLSAGRDIKQFWKRLLVDEIFAFPVFEQFMRIEQKVSTNRIWVLNASL